MPRDLTQGEWIHRLEEVIHWGNYVLDGGVNPRDALMLMRSRLDSLIEGKVKTPIDELMEPEEEASRAG